MDLFRVFAWDGTASGRADGGPLSVARHLQGTGRHDAPLKYGAWYCSQHAVSAVAESMQFWRGRQIQDADFHSPTGLTSALVSFTIPDDVSIVDLDDASALVTRGLRPSQVATRRRTVTQRIAQSIFDDGAIGLLWWSTLEAEWTNVTLFHERAVPMVSAVNPPVRLSTKLPEVQQAAEQLGIAI